MFSAPRASNPASSPTATFPASRIKTQPADEDSGSEKAANSPLGSTPGPSKVTNASSSSGGAAGTSPGDQIVGAGQEAFLDSDETAQFEADKRLIYK